MQLQNLGKIQTNVRWEQPVDDRLTGLVQMVRDVGGRASRGELLAALVVAAPADGEILFELLREYRTVDSERVHISGADVVQLNERRPGPVALHRRPR